MARATYRVNADLWTKLQDILTATPDEFNSDRDTLRGRKIENGVDVYGSGRMEGEDLSTFRGHRQAGALDYVIYSYGTPIAYRIAYAHPQRLGGTRYEWIVPSTRYSVTTSKHQGKVRTALSQISGGI